MDVRRILIIFFIALFISAAANATAKNTFAVIKSKELQQIDLIIKGFTESFPEAAVVMLDLEGKSDTKKVADFIRKNRPSAIICLGALAANTTIAVEKEIPIIFSLVINYRRYNFLMQSNVTGISMEIPPLTLFSQFRLLMPAVNSIGIPYHPSASSEIVNDAEKAAAQLNIKLVKIPVEDPSKLGEFLSSRLAECSGLWMLADTQLYNLKTRALKELILFSKNNRKPLLAFSENFLKMGAFFSISIDYKSIGSQISLVSKRIVQDNIRPSMIPVSPPIGTYTVLNRIVAQKLMGAALDESIYDIVDKVYPSLQKNGSEDAADGDEQDAE